ncbi:hypothetical protein BKH43_05160 [Helicobacter sp. 13S00401-1]|uniref:tetratricopeptide repeat-containing glycosyltransferase family protein n=1 Tax=Helicobacter sp. 13S00401-1 TaxID=1905758 RepID=UPI000BA557F8|nr:tetratricopeptide repeat protein [Helicobacter sp. 13S00401-1]PAF50291.1 hypothetical protein BKH43_05160 [Helicobacter sp. 13S00401-1]
MEESYLSLAKAAFNENKFKDCLSYCLEILANNKDNIEAWSLCAFACEELGLRAKAISYLEHVLVMLDKTDSRFIDFGISLGELYRRDGLALKALALLNSFLPLEDANLHFNIAKCYADLQDYELSIKHYIKVVKLNPNDTNALFNLANKQQAIGSKEALHYYKLAYEKGHIESGINLAYMYVNLDMLKEASLLYDELKEVAKTDFNFCFNYANFLRYSLDFKNALTWYQKAISLSQDVRCKINLAYLLLSLNKLEEGFLLYEERSSLLDSKLLDIKRKFYKNILPSEIATSSARLKEFLKDKDVVLYHEQGFGDSIMFARFIESFKCKTLQILVPLELTSLFKNLAFNVTNEEVKLKHFDICLPLPSLAFLCAKNELDVSKPLDFLAKKLYISKPSNLDSKTKAMLDSKSFKVGLNFASNPNFQNAKEKSLYPTTLLQSLPQSEDFSYFSLQYEGLKDTLASEFKVTDLSPFIKDFSQSAYLLDKLDCIVSIDSALLHLSATLKKPTIALLYKRHDWRFGAFKDGKENQTNIWYKDNFYQLTQTRLNHWDSVLTKLHALLLKLKAN